MNINGNLIKSLGYKPSQWWGRAIAEGNGRVFAGEDEVRQYLDGFVTPTLPLREPGQPWFKNIIPDPYNDLEVANVAAVTRHMDELMRVPTVVAGAVMPDACPSESTLGFIPVGGVIATKDAIHPGMHSADICCSMFCSILDSDVDATALLNAGMRLSHFGGGERARGSQIVPPASILDAFAQNRFLKDLTSLAIGHTGTQGDGNHFFYVGRLASTGQVTLVTHHGSRAPGGRLYKAGMAVAESYRRKLSPETGTHNAWIPADTQDGEDYWSALQIIREWTKNNHRTVHDLVIEAVGAKLRDRFWNEHNFVFRKSDGLFYHAKGATPAYDGFSGDTNGLTLIPLNMAEPILITKGLNAANGLGFSPHGAGRNFSRSAYLKENAGQTVEQMIASQAPGLDVRYFSGHPDISELPGAYKNAAAVQAQIDHFGLAQVVDMVQPIGNIMAGDWDKDAPWKKKRRAMAANAAV